MGKTSRTSFEPGAGLQSLPQPWRHVAVAEGASPAQEQGVPSAPRSGQASDVPNRQILTTNLVRSRFWPRMDAALTHVLRLAESLKLEGRMTSPLLVRKMESGDFEVILGHLRLEAARVLGWKSVPAVVLDCSDADAVRTIAAEHHTYPLAAYERVRMVRHLVGTDPTVSLEDIKGLLKLRSKGDASTFRSAARRVTPQVLELAGIDEVRDASALRSRIFRADLRDLVALPTDAEVAAFLRTKLTAEAEADAVGRSAEPIRELRSVRGRRRWEYDGRIATPADIQAWAADRLREIEARTKGGQVNTISL